MMRIRWEQMKAFDAEADRAFVEMLKGLVLQQGSPIPPGTDDRQLTQMIHNGIARARSHGLTWQSSIGKFVGLMFAVAPNFDEYPPIRAILANSSVLPDERVPRMMERITGEQWAGASRRYDLSAWDKIPSAKKR
jgi:hypothetical protein